MKCEDIYRYLCGYLDGELDSEKAKSVEEHLKTCQSCRRELKILQAVSSLIHEQDLNFAAPDHLKRRIILELERAEEYRESGVQALDLIRWGTHVAQLYDTKDELAEVLVPYVERGLEENELCVFVTSEMSRGEAIGLLTAEIPGLQKYIESGQLQVLSHKDWYLSTGCFNGRCTLDNGIKKYQEAVSNGYAGLRITGNVFWLEQPEWDSFMEFENLINSMISGYRMLIMCSYKESKCNKDNIVDVVNTHKYVLTKIDNSWRLRR